MTDFNWTHPARTVPARGLEVERLATPEERAIIADAFGLAACDSVKVSYRLRPLDRDRFDMAGTIDMAGSQTCVVTLEPIPCRVSQDFQIELWPEKDLAGDAANHVDPFAQNEPEPYCNDTIDIGQIVLGLLAERIDPYPRKPGAEFSWREEKPASDEKGPFAKLKRLGPRS
jgi:hypothetical protein